MNEVAETPLNLTDVVVNPVPLKFEPLIVTEVPTGPYRMCGGTRKGRSIPLGELGGRFLLVLCQRRACTSAD